MSASAYEEEKDTKPLTLEDEILQLRRENDGYRNDNIYKLFYAMNRKASEIADSLNENELKLSGDDKVFERFIKLVEKMETFTKTLAAMRQDYLKLPEDEVEETERKGIPRLEQLIQQRGKKSNK